MTNYVKAERLWLKAHPELNEKWVQGLIADDPSILGLGDLVLRAQERIHPRAGRLDLLLQDPDSLRRYEVELQLGATDETHIVRTLEYWDIERKRYPQYDHCAVLVAEDITSRFLNVMSLFNGSVPFVAIQMQALNVNGHLTIVFTRVLDELVRGLVDEDEEAEALPADRQYWENRSSKTMVAIADRLLSLARQIDPTLELKYNRHYIGLAKDGAPYNFVWFNPNRNFFRVQIRLPQTDDLSRKIDEAGLETLDYDRGAYRFRLNSSDVDAKESVLLDLMKIAYERCSA